MFQILPALCLTSRFSAYKTERLLSSEAHSRQRPRVSRTMCEAMTSSGLISHFPKMILESFSRIDVADEKIVVTWLVISTTHTEHVTHTAPQRTRVVR